MRYLRYLALLGVGCLVSMGIAFSLTRTWLRSDQLLGGEDSRGRRAAFELRSEANDLIDLAERFEAQTAPPATVSEVRPWLNNVFLPELRQLKGRIAWEEDMPVGPVRELEQAVETLLNAAQEPASPELRLRAKAEVRLAADTVERFIASSGVGRLAEPRRRLE